MGRTPVLALAALLAAGTADAQDQFEIQVYESEIAPPGTPGIEVHANRHFAGTRGVSPAGELPTQGVTRVTFEPHLGVTRRFEAGFYVQTALRPDGGYDYGGFKLRLKTRIGGALGGRLGAAVNVELAALPRRYDAARFGIEVRPIVDLALGRFYVSLNPLIGVSLGGGRPGVPDLEPAAKIAVGIAGGLSAGAEYYGGFGPIDSLAASQQTHRALAALDLDRRIGGLHLEINAAAGWGFGGEGPLVKGIIGVGR